MTPETIKQKVLTHLKASPDILESETRCRNETEIRRRVAHCLYIFTDISMDEIGKMVNRDRTAVYHMISAVKKYCQMDPFYRNEIIEIETILE